MVSEPEIKELMEACESAKAYAQAFREVVVAVAEKHQCDPQGLGRYIRARVADKIEKLESERDTIEQLTLGFGARRDAA